MNPFAVLFARFKGNPGFEDMESEGDLWAAINRNTIRVARVDERTRVALMFILPTMGFLVAVQLVCLGVLIK